MSGNLLIGCRGFENVPWAGSFYPPELPADWRFCYYSNEIRALLVPVEEWARFDAARVEVWRHDSDPAFRFVFELPGEALHAADLAARRALLEPLWPRVAAFVLKTGTRMPPRGIEALLDRPCCLEAEAPEWPELSRIWLPNHAAEPHPGGSFLVALMSQPEAGQMRFVLERLGRWMGGGRGAALFFDNPKRSAELANEARMLAELMGL